MQERLIYNKSEMSVSLIWNCGFCAACYMGFVTYTNTHGSGGTKINSAQTLLDCRTACQSLTGVTCVSFDFESNTKACYLFSSQPTLSAATESAHYRYTGCVSKCPKLSLCMSQHAFWGVSLPLLCIYIYIYVVLIVVYIILHPWSLHVER